MFGPVKHAKVVLEGPSFQAARTRGIFEITSEQKPWRLLDGGIDSEVYLDPPWLLPRLRSCPEKPTTIRIPGRVDLDSTEIVFHFLLLCSYPGEVAKASFLILAPVEVGKAIYQRTGLWNPTWWFRPLSDSTFSIAWSIDSNTAEDLRGGSKA